MRYVVVSPVRNEEQFIRLTLESMVAQANRPAQWVIVNDNSTDSTADIIRSYANKHLWIKLVDADNEGERKRGSRVIQLFNVGFTQIDPEDYDLVVKLDGDVSFAPDFFERLIEKFVQDDRLGIAGGECFEWNGKTWKLVKTPEDHVRGATKVYRRTCFDAIGGLPSVNGWDTIDEMKAQMKGWKTRGYEDILFRHHRLMGSAEGRIRGWVTHGEFSYFLRYPFPVILTRTIYRAIVERPLFLVGFALLWGYLKSLVTRQTQINDPELRHYLRKRHWRRLLFWRI